MRRILSYFISSLFITSFLCLHTKMRLWTQIKRLYLLAGLCETSIGTLQSLLFSLTAEYNGCCRERTKQVQHIWRSDNTIRTMFYQTTVLYCIVLLGFYFVLPMLQLVNSPVSCSAAGRERVTSWYCNIFRYLARWTERKRPGLTTRSSN